MRRPTPSPFATASPFRPWPPPLTPRALNWQACQANCVCVKTVELFFKWIKQHLRIKSFYGTSDNAVKTQVWIAIATYVLVAIVKKELQIERSLTDILQILSLTLFEKTSLFEALTAKNQPFPDST